MMKKLFTLLGFVLCTSVMFNRDVIGDQQINYFVLIAVDCPSQPGQVMKVCDFNPTKVCNSELEVSCPDIDL